jgi:hypothetical protein
VNLSLFSQNSPKGGLYYFQNTMKRVEFHF